VQVQIREAIATARKILAISVYNLQDVSTAYYPLFRWLWTRNPIAKIGYSIFIYDLTEDREGLARPEESYAKAGIELPPPTSDWLMGWGNCQNPPVNVSKLDCRERVLKYLRKLSRARYKHGVLAKQLHPTPA
jgi:hypothetical protein